MNGKNHDPNRDEWYTQADTVANEFAHYPAEQFRNAVILCPCDGLDSEFYKYFKLNFIRLGLKGLLATSISKSIHTIPKSGKLPIDIPDAHGSAIWFNGHTESQWTLDGTGDFRSQEITDTAHRFGVTHVITNPPFSLTSVFVEWVVANDWKFCTMMPVTSIADCAIQNLLACRSARPGYTHGRFVFVRPDGTDSHPGEIVWFTNMACPEVPVHYPVVEQPIDMSMIIPSACNKASSFSSGISKPISSLDEKVYGKKLLVVNECRKIPQNWKGLLAVPTSIFEHFPASTFEVYGSIDPAYFGINRFRRIVIRPLAGFGAHYDFPGSGFDTDSKFDID